MNKTSKNPLVIWKYAHSKLSFQQAANNSCEICNFPLTRCDFEVHFFCLRMMIETNYMPKSGSMVFYARMQTSLMFIYKTMRWYLLFLSRFCSCFRNPLLQSSGGNNNFRNFRAQLADNKSYTMSKCCSIISTILIIHIVLSVSNWRTCIPYIYLSTRSK